MSIAAALPAAGCSASPAQNILGSFFPAWMLCAAIGIVSAVIVRQLLSVAGINDRLIAPALTYTCLALAGTLAVWLIWFGN